MIKNILILSLLILSCDNQISENTQFLSLEPFYQKSHIFIWKAEYKDATCYQGLKHIYCFRKMIMPEAKQEVNQDDQDYSEPPDSE